MKVFLSVLFFLIYLVPNANSQHYGIAELQVQIKQSIKKAYSASVRVWGFDTIRKTQNSAQFSGVVVSAEGHILTVAHAIQPGRTYKVRFPDGREVMATALGRIGLADMQVRPDIGMMKIIDKGVWPAAEMGWSYSLKVNEPCISISYPETLNQLFPSVRFGRIVNVLTKWGFVQSSCKMEPGDSGGPLFDYMGRLVAMHSRCELSENENYEVPIDTYRKYWDLLSVAEDYKALPEPSNEVKADPLVGKISSVPDLVDPVSTKELTFNWKNSVIEIRSVFNELAQSAMGTAFSVDGKSVVVSKNSIVADHPVISVNGKEFNTEVAARDVENDLVLLRIAGELKNSIPLRTMKNAPVAELEALGHFLISPLPGDVRKASVISTAEFNLPRKFSAGYLGAPANFKDEKIILSRIAPNSPAAMAKLQAGDQVTGINGIPIDKAEQYGAELVKYNPGDTIGIRGIREGNNFEVSAILTKRPIGNHPADRPEGGKSLRLDGFNGVFSHDAAIRADECGGPVFDSSGKFYGINIARFSRTSTLIMPARQVAEFIKSHIY
ncbi:S1C family serine protease [Pedobacter deserti]|uniref:S1C family serine protease n=1 Tax=Pedobacter deserti TaxID=2817382 RepID=UPI00210B4263|nr:trypsin-like peptidase domain-containing protein [Pedobacter sp. SYSU D00382]